MARPIRPRPLTVYPKAAERLYNLSEFRRARIIQVIESLRTNPSQGVPMNDQPTRYQLQDRIANILIIYELSENGSIKILDVAV